MVLPATSDDTELIKLQLFLLKSGLIFTGILCNLSAHTRRYDLHVLLVEHGKRCARCASNGKPRKESHGDCPLVNLEAGPTVKEMQEEDIVKERGNVIKKEDTG